MGLANRIVETGTARAEAEKLAGQIASFPERCMRSDRQSTYEQHSLPFQEAMKNEFRLGLATLESGETLDGARRFAEGAGRHGRFD